MKHVCAAALFHVCARAAVYSSLFGSGPPRSCIGKQTAHGARLGPQGGGGWTRIRPEVAVAAKKKSDFFFKKFSKSRGRPSSRCRSVLARRGCPAPSRSCFRSDRRKKVKFFLSPVAGQVVDVRASRAGGAALLRVDLGFGPIGDGSL